MIVKSVQFVTSAVKPGQYPQVSLPEIAFAGRSNVGKSSLINTLVNRKNLVRTSSTPGRTQLINFFSLNDKMMLVDLPGFGFAKVPVAIKKQWGPMIEGYLSRRKNLRAVVLLVDVRRTPGEEERNLLAWLHAANIPALLVVTKCDKVSKNERAQQARIISDSLGVAAADLTYFSSHTKEGREELWSRIDSLVEATPPVVTEAEPAVS